MLRIVPRKNRRFDIPKFGGHWFAAFLVFAIAFASVVTGCAGANYDPTTSLGRQAILDAASIKLSKQDCSGAIVLLKPLYNSINTDNDVRMMMASANGCAATLNLFKFLGDMVTAGGGITGGGFWAFLAKEFPSTFTDDIAEGGQAAQDALLSVIDPGWVVLSNEMFNTKSFNPEAYNVNSRLTNANSYLFFASMASIGALESRYGVADASGHPTTSPPLPWTRGDTMTVDGCAYASSIVNFVDSLGVLAGHVPGTLATTLTALQTTFQTAIFTACDTGCTTALLTGCALPSCANCPLTLRDRTSCTGLLTDANSCAAAGIINMINTPGLGWN